MSHAPISPRFSSLSVKDLLEAREAYHVHLSSLENVMATAIGRYRTTDKTGARRDSGKGHKVDRPKTLQNSFVHDWSWPCVLVFVREWQPVSYFATKPDQIVPPRLYLPDGRVIPTCVVMAERVDDKPAPLAKINFPRGLTGGGYPVLSEVQGQERVGSIACMVTDGDRIYALTNRHVTGDAGRPLDTVSHGERHAVGTSSGKEVRKKPLREVYDDWPSNRVVLNLDAGLIAVDDVSEWTAQVYGVGEIGEVFDLNVDSLTLDLIGLPVRGFGGASGPMEGEVQAFFYRYQSVGGLDYLADIVIGPRPGRDGVHTRPGDSGTLWFVDDAALPTEKEDGRAAASKQTDQAKRSRRRQPIAMQWGGSVLSDPSAIHGVQFALATSLSNVLRALDVEVIRDWNIGLSEYWGKVGHYKVGAAACQLVTHPKLRKLMLANLDRVSFGDTAIAGGDLPKDNQKDFVALADVPDLVWRSRRKMDEANHFADMDQPGRGQFEGKTLIDLWTSGAAKRPDAWTAFYDALETPTPIEDKHRGALPFRVWQMYQEMVAFVKDGDVEKFVGAAGTLAHYVGDACQPLHVSFLHHGRPGHPEEEKVHSTYETTMLDRHAPELIELVNDEMKGADALTKFVGGAQAADTVVALMQRTIATLHPEDVITAFNDGKGKNQVAFMWDQLKDATAKVMVDGATTLAGIWQSAWMEGGGPAIADAKLVAIDEDDLTKLYEDRSFVESRWLRDMQVEGGELKLAGDAAGTRSARKSGPAPKKPVKKRRTRAAARRRR